MVNASLFAFVGMIACSEAKLYKDSDAVAELTMRLTKIGLHSRCPMDVISELQSDMNDWIDDELEDILGEEKYTITDIKATDEADLVEIVAHFHCHECSTGGKRGGMTVERIAFPLQWVTQAIVDLWREDNEQILHGCLGEATEAKLGIATLESVEQ